MINERIYLTDDNRVYMDTYILENSQELLPNKKRPLVLIFPGGGYKFLSDREAEPIALKFNSFGYHAAVLRYSIGEHAAMPGPLHDAAKAMKYLKDNSENWYIDRESIFVSGFSAGGHLAASLGVHWHDDDIIPFIENKEDIKPAGLILGYPVIDLDSSAKAIDFGMDANLPLDEIDFDMIHPSIIASDVLSKVDGKVLIDFATAMNAYIVGHKASDEEVKQYSPNLHVTDKCPPAFIWHGGNDGLILPRNSLKFASALDQVAVNYELHIYGTGDHGLALANEVTSNNPWERVDECTNWPEMANSWIKNIIKEEK